MKDEKNKTILIKEKIIVQAGYTSPETSFFTKRFIIDIKPKCKF